MIANWFRKKSVHLSPTVMARLANYYIPFLGAGIRITKVADDYRYLRAEMPLTWYNSNFVGTHFGGSIYAITDPFLMMMLMRNLGPDYIVWDRAAKIDFLKPGRSRLIVEFHWTEDEIQHVLSQTATGAKFLIDKEVMVQDDKGQPVATVLKTLYVRRKELASSRE